MKQEQEPASDEVLEIAPNILRIQLPIQVPGLRHVNCYALLGDDGVVLVDPGIGAKSSYKTLKARLAGAGVQLRHIHSVLVTHSHGDHFGGAPWLEEEVGSTTVAHRNFSTMFEPDVRCEDGLEREHAHPMGDTTPWGTEHFMASMPLKFRLAMKLRRRRMGRRVPRIGKRVEGGDILKMAGRDWEVVHTPGHTVDHICFHDPDQRILLAGDHVLPTITPHISGLSSRDDPLAAFFASLDLVAGLDVAKVLPAHGHPIDDLAGRTKAIREHHEERLEMLASISSSLGWADVTSYMRDLFKERSWGHMAESETYAHLEHLRLTGRAESRWEHGKQEFLVSPNLISPAG